MQTIFNASTRAMLSKRIQQLEHSSERQWGKMNVYQMTKHNTYWNNWILGNGNHTYRQELLGKILGKWALKRLLKDEKPLDKNIPTSAPFKVKEEIGDLAAEKMKWIELIQAYEDYSNPAFVHDFFGKMTKEQIGQLVFKHSDHHLRQFGV